MKTSSRDLRGLYQKSRKSRKIYKNNNYPFRVHWTYRYVQSEGAEKRQSTYRYVNWNIGIQSVTVDIW